MHEFDIMPTMTKSEFASLRKVRFAMLRHELLSSSSSSSSSSISSSLCLHCNQ